MITYLEITEKGLCLNQQRLLVFRVDSHQTPSVDSISISAENKSSISEEKASKAFDSREKNKNKENLPRGHKYSIVRSNENETTRRFSTPVDRLVVY